jgi:hypothetical protein
MNGWKKDEKIMEKISLLKSSRFVLEMLLEQEKNKLQIEGKSLQDTKVPNVY